MPPEDTVLVLSDCVGVCESEREIGLKRLQLITPASNIVRAKVLNTRRGKRYRAVPETASILLDQVPLPALVLALDELARTSRSGRERDRAKATAVARYVSKLGQRAHAKQALQKPWLATPLPRIDSGSWQP